MAILKAESTSNVANLLAQMLAWDPADRISAKDALSHACFSNLSNNGKLPIEPQARQKRNRPS
jgi:serine/threonine protein kinase